MITTKQIKKLVTEKIEDTDTFIVSVEVKPGNNILVEVDNFSGMKVSDYVAISRHIEGSLDREIEDFSLKVSSPGVGEPYKVIEQYSKNIGRTIKVRTNEKQEIKGKLLNFEDDKIVIETSEKKKIEGKKSKQIVIEQITLELKDILETNTEISFK